MKHDIIIIGILFSNWYTYLSKPENNLEFQ